MNVQNRDSFVFLEHVSIMRGETLVLRDVSLNIDAGECVAILGPNGCGKSTLIKTLTCELYPLAKPETRVELFGRNRWDVTQLRRMLGLVSSEPPVRDALGISGLEAVLTGFFSSARIWPNLTVEPWMRERAEQAISEVGAQQVAEQPIGTMSAGQQKRVLIARALVASGLNGFQRVLLMDEPSNALDLAAQRELRHTMQRLALQGTGLILVTHHVEDIVPAVDRVIMMQNGRVVSDGLKTDALTDSRLSELFHAKVTVRKRDGYYMAY